MLARNVIAALPGIDVRPAVARPNGGAPLALARPPPAPSLSRLPRRGASTKRGLYVPPASHGVRPRREDCCSLRSSFHISGRDHEAHPLADDSIGNAARRRLP